MAELNGARREELRLNTPVLVDIHNCCVPLGNLDVATLFDKAWKAIVPPHTLRQQTVADGAEVVTEKQALEKLGLKRSHFHDMIQKGVLPKPMKVGTKKSVWLLSELRHRYAAHLSKSR